MQAWVLALLGLVGVAVCHHNEELVRHINGGGHGWTAGRNGVWEGKGLETHIQRMMGTKIVKTSESTLPRAEPLGVRDVPTSFDPRQQWSSCKSLTQIRNQAECGSCWAFGAVEAFTDRYCIASNATSNPIMAAEPLVACDETSMGCEGGSLGSAWYYIEREGLPTVDCQKYTVPTCADPQPCLPPFKPTPSCKKTCDDGKAPATRYHVSKVFNVPEREMQEQLMTYGPIEASMTVYEDFVHYTSGVYKHVSGKALGGHAIKLMGWGEDNGNAYWLCANSWTTSWGEEGYFRIARGHDEVGIESGCVAGTPKL